VPRDHQSGAGNIRRLKIHEAKIAAGQRGSGSAPQSAQVMDGQVAGGSRQAGDILP